MACGLGGGGGGGGGGGVVDFEMSPNKIFMCLINPPSGNAKMQKLMAKHIFECLEKRKGQDGKSKYSRTLLINNLLAIYR